MSSSSSDDEIDSTEPDSSTTGLCKQCGVFGPLYGDELCELCYNDSIDQINSPHNSDDDSLCEVDEDNDEDNDESFDNNEVKETSQSQRFFSLINLSMKYSFHGESVDCSICYEKLKNDDEVITLPCAHTFHFSCAVSWIKEHDNCPLCRNPISESFFHHESQLV